MFPYPLSSLGDYLRDESERLNLTLLIGTLLIMFCLLLGFFIHPSDGLDVVNRLFPFEPSFFSRLRWSSNALSILDAAEKKAQGRPYRLARGDKELTVLPVALIPHLNRLGSDILDARQSHAFAFSSQFTGLALTVKANYQSRILQRRVSPALPELFLPVATQISESTKRNFLGDDKWKDIEPLAATVPCFSEAMSIMLFGTNLAKDPKLVELTYKLTEDLFAVALMLRFVPSILHPLLVWLLPAKWRLNRKWRELKTFVAPEVQRLNKLKEEGKSTAENDLLFWMVRDASTAFEKDPSVLTVLCGSVVTASIFSIANLMCHMLADLAAHSEVLEAVRAEIRSRHGAIGGRWDMAALSNLDKLESAMKETARLASSPLIVYSRVVKQDYMLDGIHLKKGQFITMSGRERTMNPAIFENPESYNGLRFCQPDKLEEHRAKAFRTVDTDILTWGAGRAACPGRVIADMAAKIFLVQLLDKYDFALVDGKPLKPCVLHEFVYFNPKNKIMMRRREDSVGIKF